MQTQAPHHSDRSSPRQKLLLDRGWRFHLGDIESPLPNTHIAAYMNHKAGWSRGAARSNYDDSDWRVVDLPHDWSVEGKFDPNNHVDAGFLPRGIGWYRRHFRLEESDRGRYLAIQFDGVATHCTVYVNGHLLHRHFCGYTPFTIDISDIANFGDELNVIAVKVDATYMEGWWYEGAGLYRHVWLLNASTVHIATDGVVVSPSRTFDRNWQTQITTRIENTSSDAQRAMLISRLVGPQGQSIEQTATTVEIVARSTADVSQMIPIANPALWTCQSPNLYAIQNEILTEEQLVDSVATRFGYRTIRFDPNDGFFLNDQPLKLKGTCNHQDHAGLGVALPDSIHRFRIKRLLEMRSNAYRCAHNPPAPELLDACDELGMLVIDENRSFGSSPEHLSQLSAMVRRDRNHPCVILWSICNEEAIQGTPVAARIARTMVDAVKRLDPSRPVTGAVSGGLMNDEFLADPLDVVGINYLLDQHDAFHARHADKPLVAAETHSVAATRGATQTDPSTFTIADNDTEALPWGCSGRRTWEHVSARPWLAGLFAWTGFDYRGEPSPHHWPCVSSFFGIMDTCGFAKESFYLHQTLFNPGVRPAVDEASPPGEAVAVALEIHPTMAEEVVAADGEFNLPITAFAVDASGRRVKDANHQVQFTIEGPGRIMGVGNGDPTCHEPDKGTSRSLFKGLAQVIVQTTNEPGEIILRATSQALRPAELRWRSVAAPIRPFIAPAMVRHLIGAWRRSPFSSARPDQDASVSDTDMNSWERIDPAQSALAAPSGGAGYTIYRATFAVPKIFQPTGGQILLHEVVGAAAIYLDGRLVAEKKEPAPEAIRIRFPVTSGKVSLAALIESRGQPVGIRRAVEILPP